MNDCFQRNRAMIRIEGACYSSADFTKPMLPGFAHRSDDYRELALFLRDWFSESPVLTVQTSGSTGQPKRMKVEKTRMIESARMTCSFLHLQKGDTALLCLPLRYIAGKMMVVRALVAGLDLYPVAPSGHPLKEAARPYTFAAMVPLQVFNSLREGTERDRLSAIRSLLIGGGAVDPGMEQELQMLPNPVYSTYGMTETLSHIALRRLNGEERSSCYTPFGSVALSLSDEGTLCIEAPLVYPGKLRTNDLAELLPDGRFRILGRTDNVIDSGGIKIQIEEVEERLAPFLPFPFAVSSLPDPRLGEMLVLVSEKPVTCRPEIERALPPYFIPRKYIEMERIPLTGTGKISRSKLKELLEQACL